MKYARFFLVVFVLCSWVTHPIGGGFTGDTVSNPLQRMTLGDILGFVGLGIFLVVAMHRRIAVPEIFRYALLFLLFLLPGIVTSHKPFATFFEIFILTYLLLIGVALYNLFKSEQGLLSLIKVVATVSLLASFVGLYDLVAGNAGLPMFFKPRMFEADGVTSLAAGLIGEAKSGFRNAGQAGSWVLHMLTILLPLIFSSLFAYYKKSDRRYIKVSAIVSIIFLFATFKVASLIGIVIGGLLYAVIQRKTNFIFGTLVFILFGSLLFPLTESLAPAFHNRVTYKFATRITANVAEQEGEAANVQQGFIKNNLSLAVLAFQDNPLTGSGIGGFSGRYMNYEVHSSPFKVIGETGMLGIVSYVLFMLVVGIYFLRAYTTRGYNPFKSFLVNMFPFYVGCVVSWGYTWHMRKRSFWVMLIIIALSSYMMRQWTLRQQQLDTTGLD